MPMQSPDVEREWAAEKRDFVSDRRDQLAAERDAVADVRASRPARGRQTSMTGSGSWTSGMWPTV